MTWLERNRVHYVFGLAGNRVLLDRVAALAEDAAVRRAEEDADKVRSFHDFRYAARSWTVERRTIARIEATRKGSDSRFVVTNLARVCHRVRRRFPWLVLVFANDGYRGDQATCAATQERLRLEIVKRPRDAQGFHLLPRRWVIERTFAWLGRNRRLSKDVETLIETSTAMAAVAIVQLLVRRLAGN